MKRNMDLVRDLLLEIEAMPAGSIYETDSTSLNFDGEVLCGHLELLEQAGFVKPLDGELSGNLMTSGLTWAGHEFLDAIRSDGVWAKIKTTLREKAIGPTFEVVKALGIAYAKQFLGLSD